MALDNEEYVFPDDDKDTTAEVVDYDEDNIEVDVVDDTPTQDRNRAPLPKEIVDELENDDLTDYSEKVKSRMSQLRKVYHDERREKEAASREREEALRYAQNISEENRRLKSNLSSGEKSYIDVSKHAAEQEMDLAKREYREAYDSGDSDKIIDAQQRMNSAQYKLTQVQNYRAQYDNALQAVDNNVNIQPEQTQTVRPDKKAIAWQETNDWFGRDEEMTSLALGLHEKLVRSGVSPTSDDYYRRIDSTMRKRFPEQFEDNSLDTDKPAQRTKPSTVVASATRSTAPKKVQISKTAQVLARKLGISPEQYAKEMIKLEKQNG
jgi:hypothetical protein